VKLSQVGSAWVEQKEDVMKNFISPLDFGAAFDGVTDDRAYIQAAIDEAATTGRPIQMPGATALISDKLVFTDRRIVMRGIPGMRTIIKAGAAMDCVLDFKNTTAGNDDGSYSPFILEGIVADGNNLAEVGIDIQFAHNFDLRNCRVISCNEGIREKDTWGSRFFNVRSDGCAIGWNVIGAANSTSREGCTITAFSSIGLRVFGNGTYSSSTEAMTWTGLDVEFAADPAAVGIETGENTYIDFNQCYLFENVARGIINRGKVQINGGNIYFGFVSSNEGGYLFRPLTNTLTVTRASLNGQDFAGNGQILCGLTDMDITTGNGAVALVDIQSNFPIPSAGPIKGDFLGYAPSGGNIVPLHGAQWSAFTSGGCVASDTVTASGRGRRIECTTAGGFMTLTAQLFSRNYIIGKPLYQIWVVEANCPIAMQFANSPDGANPPDGVASFVAAQLAPIAGIWTYILMDQNAPAGAFTHLNIGRAGSPLEGDFITLHSVSIADCVHVKGNVSDPGTCSNLAKL